MTQSSAPKLAPPSLALVGAAALLFGLSGSPGDLAAEGGSAGGNEEGQEHPDTDADGLSDAQELVMGTNPAVADTDGDGFSDLEELARQSDPNQITSLPADTPVNVGLAARVENDVLHVITAMYLRHDETAGYGIKIGIMVDGQLAQLPSQVFLFGSSIQILEGKNPADRIALLETPYPSYPVHDLGQLSFWSLVTPSAMDEPAEADVLDLFSDPEGPEIVHLDFLAGDESIYRPIDVDPPASSWSPGQICVQRSMNVGNVGPVAEHLVETATCETADAYCSPSCPSLSGTSFQVVDPLALLGG